MMNLQFEKIKMCHQQLISTNPSCSLIHKFMSSSEDQLGRFQVAYTEMTEADQVLSYEIAVNALKLQDKGDQAVYQKDIAQNIKQELDRSKGGTWNVIVGKSFGSFVTHETKSKNSFNVARVTNNS